MLEAQAAAKIQVTQNAAPEIGYGKPPPQQKGTARQIAEETGLSVDTVRRALKPAPVANLVSVKEAAGDSAVERLRYHA
ncbi:hypothetical protein [Sphingobium xenophagum]|uniref:hypothetical protein n=1 Tax=Sphingobium xenophagum TaxID=121428 RepID=UPI0002E0080F|nr:hypothetical protein [Sphingobium xenophagum]